MALVEVPADVTRLILREVYGQIGDQLYDEPSWSATRTKQVAAGLTWSLRFTPMLLSEFLTLAGQQGRSDLYIEAGRWVNRYRDRGTAPAVFDSRNLLGLPSFTFTPRTELVTRITVFWDYDDAHQQWRKSQELVSSREARVDVQRGRKTKDDEPKRLELRWVRDDTTALRLGQYWLGQWDRQHLLATIQGGWEALKLEKGDLFQVTSGLLTKYGSLWFRVRSKTYNLADDRIGLIGSEEPAVVLEKSAQAKVKITASLSRSAAAAVKPLKVLGALAAYVPAPEIWETLLPGDSIAW
jgi:hypothetical protein